jgi:Ca2+-binding EF-hand superfamily protein
VADNDYEATFALIDVDGDGKITAEELKHVFTALGEDVTDEAVSTMLSFLDEDNDGLISQQELTAYLSNRDIAAGTSTSSTTTPSDTNAGDTN